MEAIEQAQGECNKREWIIEVVAMRLTLLWIDMDTVQTLVHESLSEDLAQLALLYSMNGEHDKALAQLHKRLVIHEMHGPGTRLRCDLLAVPVHC